MIFLILLVFLFVIFEHRKDMQEKRFEHEIKLEKLKRGEE